MHDEPLEGDIGPSAPGPSASTPAPASPGDQLAELRRQEAEREERRRHTNTLAGRITLGFVAGFLVFLTIDSVRTAVEAHSRGDDWLYPPAVIAAVCATGLAALCTWFIRRARRQGPNHVK